jgi:hypothetical protein
MAQTKALIGWCDETLAMLDGMVEPQAAKD